MRPFQLPTSQSPQTGKKKFIKGSKPSENAFPWLGEPVNEAEVVIILEAVIDLITAYQVFPDAHCIAIGGTSFTKKLKQFLKPVLEKKIKVVTFYDNDDAGDDAAIATTIAMNRTTYAVEWPETADRGADINDLLKSGAIQTIQTMLAQAKQITLEDAQQSSIKSKFPRKSFPWEVLPESIANSLKQLARACATSPTSLPAKAAAVLSSVIGSKINVSPKSSWAEPMVIYSADIRASGLGKSPAEEHLTKPLEEAQRVEDEDYRIRRDQWDRLTKKNQDAGLMAEPTRPHGYLGTDVTVEGLHADHDPEHGGKLLNPDELSAFFSGQNQYKQKGTDREAFLRMHSGKTVSINRARGSMAIRGARISIIGGIQPDVWVSQFSGKTGRIYKTDGTIFRFLPTYEGDAYFPLTDETWETESVELWDRTIKNAMRWAKRQGVNNNLNLDDDAAEFFIEWRNGLHQIVSSFPKEVRGFIPKITGYTLRFSGLIHLMGVFSRNETPGTTLTVEDVKKGIEVSEFYLGHILAAMELFHDSNTPAVFEYTEQVRHLVKILKSIKGDADSDRLAVGFIQDAFNKDCPKGQKINSPRAMGAVLRNCGLNIPVKRGRVRGKAGVKFMLWDESTETLIEEGP